MRTIQEAEEAAYQTYCNEIPGYKRMTKSQKKKAKKVYKMKAIKALDVAKVVENVALCIPKEQWHAADECKKENNMYTLEEKTKDYARSRITDIYDTKDIDLRRKFNLTDDIAPYTAEDLVQRIKDGKYQIQERQWFHCHAMDQIRWRDPDAKADQAGYDAAKENLDTARQKFKDRVMLGTNEDALKAIDEFEAFTI